MSWNNILPWDVIIKMANYQAALVSGAFDKDINASEMREDYFY